MKIKRISIQRTNTNMGPDIASVSESVTVLIPVLGVMVLRKVRIKS